jgi:hypothetical protein
MNTYTPATRMLKALRMSKNNKIKHGWSREVGSGFILDEVESASFKKKVPSGEITLSLKWGHTQTIDIKELNLRETEILTEWAEQEVIREQITALKAKIE